MTYPLLADTAHPLSWDQVLQLFRRVWEIQQVSLCLFREYPPEVQQLWDHARAHQMPLSWENWEGERIAPVLIAWTMERLAKLYPGMYERVDWYLDQAARYPYGGVTEAEARMWPKRMWPRWEQIRNQSTGPTWDDFLFLVANRLQHTHPELDSETRGFVFFRLLTTHVFCLREAQAQDITHLVRYSCVIRSITAWEEAHVEGIESINIPFWSAFGKWLETWRQAQAGAL